MALEVITNNIPREILNAWDLTEKERSEFDHLNFDGQDDFAQFFRYKENVYHLQDIPSIDINAPKEFAGWNGLLSETFFSGILVRWANDFESVIVGRYYS
jgi:hypothetical protein